MTNYFILNLETEKLELHFEKETYAALLPDQKKEIKSNFLWSRNSGCWISRSKEPNLYSARRCAEKIGLRDAGKTGERLSFAEQMERKAERAERRADRYEGHADAARERGKTLQKPLTDMHGDIAFFTQPNINSNAGRAFARKTAGQKELQDKGFLCRRIKEQESNVRKLKKSIEQYERYAAAYEKGETPLDRRGDPLRVSAEAVQNQLESWLDRLEVVLDKLGFYQDCLDAVGGVGFSCENVKAGYVLKVERLGCGKVISTGLKNCTVLFGTLPLTVAYAEIIEIISAKEDKPGVHPYKKGDTFTCHRWNHEIRNTEKVTFTVIRASDKSITLRCGEEKLIVRKPSLHKWPGKWCVKVTDWNDGLWYKEQAKVTEDK